MRGTDGILHTGHEAVDTATGRAAGQTASTVISFSPMKDDEIDAYVATGEPLHVAGSFTLDGLSAPFIERVNGDPSNVIGISLPTVRALFASLGIRWLDVVNYG
jgi:septum formation protein